MMNFFHAFALVFALLGAVGPACAADGPRKDSGAYQSGYTAIMKLGYDLQKALEGKYKDIIHSQPVFLETDTMPFIRLVEYPGDAKPMKSVFISAGFIDLMNLVAHAKAIDRTQKGFFEKYVLELAKESGARELLPLPGNDNQRYWTENMMNEQLSGFNQMVGMVLAIELSHHYLGHFKKHADKLEDANGKPIPINNLLTPSEWDDSLKAGAKNALDCGFGVEGLKALYDAISRMPQRPVWTSYFLPANAKVDKVKKDLEKLEKKFFAGELQ